MEAVLKLTNPTESISSLGVYEAVTNDADPVLYPILLNGRYYHLRKMDNGKWGAIGLSDGIADYIGKCIECEI